MGTQHHPEDGDSDAILRRFGFDDEAIAQMSPTDREAAIKEALRGGTSEVDAEFIDVDKDLPASYRPPIAAPKHERPWGFILALTCLAGAALYWVFVGGDDAKQTTVSEPLGWSDLLDCSYTVSLDGTKELDLFDNQNVVFYDKSTKENGKYRTIDGTWAFDETTKLYAVTLGSEVTNYSIVEPEGAAGICMLVKGQVGAADLRASWFSTLGDDQGDTDPEPIRGD